VNALPYSKIGKMRGLEGSPKEVNRFWGNKREPSKPFPLKLKILADNLKIFRDGENNKREVIGRLRRND
jgi:hypothetical protein